MSNDHISAHEEAKYRSLVLGDPLPQSSQSSAPAHGAGKATKSSFASSSSLLHMIATSTHDGASVLRQDTLDFEKHFGLSSERAHVVEVPPSAFLSHSDGARAILADAGLPPVLQPSLEARIVLPMPSHMVQEEISRLGRISAADSAAGGAAATTAAPCVPHGRIGNSPTSVRSLWQPIPLLCKVLEICGADKSVGVDSISADTFEVRGVYAGRRGFCQFSVHVFSADNENGDGGQIVDLRMLSGDVSDFINMQKSFMSQLASAGATDVRNVPRPAMATLGGDAPHLVEADAQMVDHVCEMLSAETAEMQRQGLALLSVATESEANLKLLADNTAGLATILASLEAKLRSKDQENVYIATRILANITVEPRMHEVLHNLEWFSPLLVGISAADNQVPTVTRLQAVRALTNCQS